MLSTAFLEASQPLPPSKWNNIFQMWSTNVFGDQQERLHMLLDQLKQALSNTGASTAREWRLLLYKLSSPFLYA